MKTFKLIILEIIDVEKEVLEPIDIPLLDGLIINREDDKNSWLIEAYIENEYRSLFNEIKEKNKELIVHVKITTEMNDKATCLTSIIGMNEIGNKMNVLFLGTIIEKRTEELENMLRELSKKGYRGVKLLNRFKEQLT